MFSNPNYTDEYNYVFEGMGIVTTKEQRDYYVNYLKEIGMLNKDADVYPIGDIYREALKAYPGNEDASVGTKSELARRVLRSWFMFGPRGEYNSIFVVGETYSPYNPLTDGEAKDQMTLISQMSDASIIIEVDSRLCSEVKAHICYKKEYMRTHQKMLKVPKDGSRLDKFVEEYERAMVQYDLPWYDFRDTVTGDREERFNYADCTLEEFREALRYLRAIKEFLKEHPEEADLFNRLDVEPDEFGVYDFTSTEDWLNPEWIGLDEDGDYVFSGDDSLYDELV